jgi:RNA polymerase sigma-70 factor (ECF subfamily)
MILSIPTDILGGLWNLLFRPGSILMGAASFPSLHAAARPSPQAAGSDRPQERELVQEALRGEPGFERLVRLYERLVYRVAYRFLGDEHQAADVAQEVFLRVYKALPGFRGESSLSSWIYAITANLSRNALRSGKRSQALRTLSLSDAGEDETPLLERIVDMKVKDADRILEGREFSKGAQAALMKLAPDYREAVVLRDVEGLDYAEIAELLKVEVGTVKSRISRGRAQLREELKDWL